MSARAPRDNRGYEVGVILSLTLSLKRVQLEGNVGISGEILTNIRLLPTGNFLTCYHCWPD